MRTHTHALFASAALALTTTWVGAQRQLLVVDAAGGPGSSFTAIQPAIDAARNGDTVVVRPGDYLGFTINGKAISVIGSGSVRLITSLSRGQAVIGLFNAPAGRDVVVSGFEITATPVLVLGVEAESCPGRVFLERIIESTDIGNRIRDCSQVMVDGCTLRRGTTVQRSTVTFSECTLSSVAGALAPGGPGLGVDNGTVTCSRCDISGGFGLGSTPAAIELRSAHADLTDDGNHLVSVGPSGFVPAAPAVAGTGTVTVDPRVVLQSLGGAPQFAPTIAVTTRSIPSLAARGAKIGGQVTIDLAAGAGDLFAMVIGLPGDTLPFPAFGGSLWIDPRLIVVAASGVLGASGSATLQIGVPAQRSFVGPHVVWQAVAGPPTALTLSNASGYAHGL